MDEQSSQSLGVKYVVRPDERCCSEELQRKESNPAAPESFQCVVEYLQNCSI